MISPIQGNVSIIYWRLYSQTYLYRAQTKIIYIEACHDKAAVRQWQQQIFTTKGEI